MEVMCREGAVRGFFSRVVGVSWPQDGMGGVGGVGGASKQHTWIVNSDSVSSRIQSLFRKIQMDCGPGCGVAAGVVIRRMEKI